MVENRYDRQVQMLGAKAQEKLGKATVVIVGCGGLGSVVAEILARAGVGELVLVDHDMVELTNLQRQAVYTEKDVGKLKAEVLSLKLSKINSEIKITGVAQHLALDNNVCIGLGDADVVVDCTDNMEARRVIEKSTKVWVHGAAAKDKGTVKVFTGAPNEKSFEDIYPGNVGDTCAEGGILGATAHIVAAIQANEAIKIIVGEKAGEVEKDLLRIDATKNTVEHFKVKKK